MRSTKQPDRKNAVRTMPDDALSLWQRWLASLERSVFRGEPGLATATLRVTRHGVQGVEIEIGGNVVGELRGPDAEHDLTRTAGRWESAQDREADPYHRRLTAFLRRHPWPDRSATHTPKPTARKAWTHARAIYVRLTDGRQLSFLADHFRLLKAAPPHLLSKVAIRDQGAALRWEELDEDISIEGLLKDPRVVVMPA